MRGQYAWRPTKRIVLMKQFRLLIALCALPLVACSGNDVKHTLGLNRSGPDEFKVVSRPPLSVPPQFNLRPPATAGETAAMTATDKQAKAQLLGKGEVNLDSTAADTAVTPVDVQSLSKASKLQKTSGAESQFLKNAGADQSDKNVREKLEEEKYAAQPQPEDSWWNNMFSSDKTGKKDPIVNARGESDRIKENQDEGKSITDGDTPEVKGRDTGLLGKIFGY